MKLFSTRFKNFFKTVFKTVLNFYKTFSKLFSTFFSFVWLSPCCVISLLLLLWTISSVAPIAPRHAASRNAGWHARCAALRIVSALATATPLCCYQQRRLALCAFILLSMRRLWYTLWCHCIWPKCCLYICFPWYILDNFIILNYVKTDLESKGYHVLLRLSMHGISLLGFI